MQPKKKTVTKKRVATKKTAAKAVTKKSAKTPKKLENLQGWRKLIGIGLVNGKRPKRDTRPDKDIIWGD